MEIVMVVPGKLLAIAGGLGPLQSIAATGSMKIMLSMASGDTKLEVTYSLSGYLHTDMFSAAEFVQFGTTPHASEDWRDLGRRPSQGRQRR